MCDCWYLLCMSYLTAYIQYMCNIFTKEMLSRHIRTGRVLSPTAVQFNVNHVLYNVSRARELMGMESPDAC